MSFIRKTEYDISGQGAGSDGKYDIAFTTYPLDLFDSAAEKYARSWVMFNINVQSQSSFGKQEQWVQLSDAEKRRFTNFDTRNQTKFGAIGSAASTGAAVTGSASLIKSLNSGQYSGVAKGLVSGATAATVAVAPATLLAGTAKRETKRISTAIQLPMPNNLITGYTADWGADDTNLFDMMLRAPGTAWEVIKTAATGTFSDALTTAGDPLAALSLSANNAAMNGGVSAMTGLAVNPKKEMIFQGVGFRTFTVEYKFFPKNQQEMETIDSIILLFKYHMHPEYKTDGRYTFIYPSEFDITFFTNTGQENPWICKIATCVLTDMKVNYTPDGAWVAHDGGAPNAVQLSLTFRELSILTKEDIQYGY